MRTPPNSWAEQLKGVGDGVGSRDVDERVVAEAHPIAGGERRAEVQILVVADVAIVDSDPGAIVEKAQRGVEAQRMARAAHLLAAVGVLGIEIGVGEAQGQRVDRPESARELDTLPLALAVLVRRRADKVRRREEGDDLVVEVLIEVGEIDDHPVVEEALLHAQVPAEALFRVQIGIGVELPRDEAELLEHSRVLHAGPDRAVQPCPRPCDSVGGGRGVGRLVLEVVIEVMAQRELQVEALQRRGPVFADEAEERALLLVEL